MDEAAIVIGVDTGGTFTDVFSSSGRVYKLPSTPGDPSRAILDGLRAAGLTPNDAVAHGTTVATNAVLERKGARTALITTSGFEDVIEIRRQNRPDIYDLDARWPDPLVSRDLRLGIRERLDPHGSILTPIDPDELSVLCESLRKTGPESVAVCLLFSYVNSSNEAAVADAVRRALGSGIPVTVSHDIAPQYGEYERTSTTVVNAYIMPVMRRYLGALQDRLGAEGVRTLHVMHSNGGLIGARQAANRPVQTVLSGPAAGVVGARALTVQAGQDRIITFDMGGTSTDVSVVPGEIMESGEGEISSFPLLIPMLTIETVGAGGGSIARVDAAGGLHVGPESAGADPGPAAYGKGMLPTVTDANLVLGRISPGGLLGGAMPLDGDRARSAIRNIAGPLSLTLEEAAWAVVRLANSNMGRAVRTVTLQRGHDPRRFALFPFGGAGPLHAADLAADLGMDEVLVPPHPGIMAALGLTVPDLQRDFQRTTLVRLTPAAERTLEAAFADLEQRVVADLEPDELFSEPILHRFLDMRYTGQSFELRVPYTGDAATLVEDFTQSYADRYGYNPPHGQVEVVTVRVRARLPRRRRPVLVPAWGNESRELEVRQVWFGSGPGVRELQSLSSRVLWRPALSPGTQFAGPTVVEQYDSVTIVPPGWEARVDEFFNLRMHRM